MKLSYNYFSIYGASFFKECIVTSLTTQHKKILVIVSMAFAFLALCYAMRRCFFGNRSPTPLVKINEPIDKTSQKQPVLFQFFEVKQELDKNKVAPLPEKKESQENQNQNQAVEKEDVAPIKEQANDPDVQPQRSLEGPELLEDPSQLQPILPQPVELNLLAYENKALFLEKTELKDNQNQHQEIEKERF